MIDLVWIDVQGAEGDVIEGMGEKIKSINYVWIEYGEKAYEDALSREETIKLFEDKGFYLVNHLSSKHQTGDLLFSRKKINLFKYFFPNFIMVIIKLTNGFGNNLFQYIAGRLLAEFHNQSLFVSH